VEQIDLGFFALPAFARLTLVRHAGDFSRAGAEEQRHLLEASELTHFQPKLALKFVVDVFC
jgi:hypothetical protein